MIRSNVAREIISPDAADVRFLYVVSDLQSDTVYYLDFQSANINAMASVLLCCGLIILILTSVGAQIRRNAAEHPPRREVVSKVSNIRRDGCPVTLYKQLLFPVKSCHSPHNN